MSGYVLRRLLQGIITVVLVASAVFVLTSYIGDPVRQLLPPDHTPEDYERMARVLGYDRPFWEQYWDFLRNAMTGNLGISAVRRVPAMTLVFERFPITLTLAVAAIAVASMVAIPIGILGGLRPGRIADRFGMLLSTLGLATPTFVLGVVLVVIFGVRLKWFPVGGLDSWTSYVLPVIALAAWAMAALIRLAQSETAEVMKQSYVRLGRAKGLGSGRLLFGHIVPCSMLPVATYMGLEFGMLLAGAVMTEAVFSVPGLGLLALNSVLARDRPVIMATVVTIAVSFVLVNLVTDIVISLLDPRIRLGRRV